MPTDTSPYAITPPPQASVAIINQTARFPVRRIFCVGRNYAEHAREMGNDPDREPPFFFTKPADAVVDSGQDKATTLPYPPLTQDLHHEVELVIAIGRGGHTIPADQALDHIWGAAVGIDMTRRDLQAAAKATRRPWDWGKAFDNSAPIAPLTPIAHVPSLSHGKIWLSVNGHPRQTGDLADQIWPVADMLAHLSQAVTLAPGDLVMTGTPAGVGPCGPGDHLTAGIEGLPSLSLRLTKRA